MKEPVLSFAPARAKPETLKERQTRCPSGATSSDRRYDTPAARPRQPGFLLFSAAYACRRHSEQLPEIGTLELLREIHDATGCPVFMLANKDLQDRICRTVDPDHARLYSRVDIMYPLTQGRDINSGGRALFTVEEIRKLYELTPIRLSPDAQQYLQGVANALGCGSLRRCRILLLNAARRARKRAGLDDESTVTVTADDLAYVDERLRPQDTEIEVVKRRRAMAAVAKTG